MKAIEQKIEDEEDFEEEFKVMKKSMVKNVIFNIVLLLIIIIISFIFKNRVSLLSVINPRIFYFFAIIAFVLLVAFLILMFFTLNDNVFSNETWVNIYKKYDLVSFIFLTCIIISFVTLFIVTPTTVVGTSMEPTMQERDKIMVWHVGYSPKRDDIIVIDINDHYDEPKALYIKRVVAVAGDKVEYIDGQLVVNDKEVQRISESQFKIICSTVKDKNDDVSIKDGIVPKGYSVVLGDNRNASYDSRAIGLIYNEDVLGKAFFRVFPFNKLKIY